MSFPGEEEESRSVAGAGRIVVVTSSVVCTSFVPWNGVDGADGC